MTILRSFVVALAGLIVAGSGAAGEPRHDAASPEGRAVAYLAGEVPRWSTENKCFSCHNNGDAVRALCRAVQIGYAVSDKALLDSKLWLAHSERWDHNGGEVGVSDSGLARIQFAAALVAALDAGRLRDRQALVRAAQLVADCQQKNGSWQGDANGVIGSPVTYGPALASYQASRVLAAADGKRFRTAIAMAEDWLLQLEPRSNLDAAAVLLASAGRAKDPAKTQRLKCLKVIHQSQSANGGWGPYLRSAPEAFDTAIVLLALATERREPDFLARSKRGRLFLISTQQADGSWQETTRPPGAESYAQRISTTAWALLALLATQER